MIEWIKDHPIIAIVVLLIFAIFLEDILKGNGSQRSSQDTDNYCQYPGCTQPPSGFWDKGTGYCSRHAQQLRDDQKLLDKIKQQGH